MTYVPPNSRESRVTREPRSLSETVDRYAPRYNQGRSTQRPARGLIRTKQDCHLFESMMGTLKGNEAHPERFGAALVHNYLDNCTAFLHVHQHELGLNSFLGTCNWWTDAAISGIQPEVSAGFASSPLVHLAYESVFGLRPLRRDGLPKVPAEFDKAAVQRLSDLFITLRATLRNSAMKIKNDAQVPTDVPEDWQEALGTMRISNHLQVSASHEDTHKVYELELADFYKQVVAVTEASPIYQMRILQRLEKKAAMQFAKLTEAQRHLCAGPASPENS